MSALPELHPIVHPAIKVVHDGFTYTCQGDGLTKNGYRYDPDVAKHLPLLQPVLTQKGTVKVHQPRIQRQPQTYWQAQCHLRGLRTNGMNAILQGRLRIHGDAGMPDELAELERKTNAEFLIKNHEQRDDKWKQMGPDEKAELDPKRFLVETFKKSKQTVVLLKLGFRHDLQQTADKLGLPSNFMYGPEGKDGDRWVVVGKTQKAVMEKLREAGREISRIKQREEDEKNEEIELKHKEVVEQLKKGKAGKKDWDVTGHWSISCPSLEEGWDVATDLSLDIYRTKSGNTWDFFAIFDFGVVKGVMRFEKPEKPKPAKKSAKGRKQAEQSEEDEDEEDEEEDDEDDEDEYGADYGRSPTPEELNLDADDKPSARCPDWNYTWRGEETGEGEISYTPEFGSMTFGGPGGTKVTGVFSAQFVSGCDFTGVKVGPAEGRAPDVGSEWASYKYAAYEEARVGRWRRW